MNKKAMALAVAGVLVAPAALAQTSNVQLYGRAVLGIDDYRATGARDQAAPGQVLSPTTNPAGEACTAVQSSTLGACIGGSSVDRKSRVRIFDNSSRVGLRGTEDLGNGLKAIFQIETGVNIDNGSNTGQGGQANASSGFWATRDSFAGLDSNWGRLTFGRQSIYWANGVNAQFAANYINTEIPWTNGTQLGRVSASGATPARVSNVVQYTTPTFAGLNATLSYSPNAQEAVQGEGQGGCIPGAPAVVGCKADGYLWGATVRGTWGPFYAQVDYADVNGNTPTNILTGATPPRGDGQAWKVGASWGYMPGARIGVIWVYTQTNNAFSLTQANAMGFVPGDKVNQDGWTINWEHTFGNFQVMAQYGWTNNIKNCDNPIISCGDSSSRGYMVGGRYFLSKRTWLFASWNLVDNKSNQFADFTGGAITSTNASAGNVPFGADPQIWALGIFHQF
ncbi:MAG TPA: porin [Burkholderiales bacterium]|nr:porin [Burkholderiales bacterium]